MPPASSSREARAVERSAPGGEQRVDRAPAPPRRAGRGRRRSRQAVVGVLGDRLRTAAAEDLHAARAADAGRGRARRRRGSPPRGRRGRRRACTGAAARAPRHGATGRRRRSTGPSARAPSGRRSGAGCPRGGSRRPRPRPRRRGTGASARACPPARPCGRRASGCGPTRRSRGPPRGPAPTAPAGHARPRHVADDRAHGLLLALARASSLRCRLNRGGEPSAAATICARDGLQLVARRPGALDEEDVQALVAAGGEQQRAAGRPSRPARPASW